MRARDLLASLVEDIQECYDTIPDEGERWARIGRSLESFLRRDEIATASLSWSVPSEGGPYNLRFYEDLERGFIIHGLIKAPNISTPIHDHGSSWTAYGLLRGEERVVVVKPDAAQAGKFEVLFDRVVKPGHVDVVEPEQLHSEASGSDRSVAVIVRSARVDNTLQTQINPVTGASGLGYGPKQLPADIETGMAPA